MNKYLKTAILAIMILLSLPGFAQKPRLRYGIQWGYNAQVVSGSQYTYLTDIGYRVSDGEDPHADYYTNAFVCADLGIEFFKSFALSASIGYRGVAEDYRVFPAELQLSWFLRGYETSGVFFSAGGGTALTEGLSADDGIIMLSAGTGYRHSLSHKINLDGFVKVRHTSCSPLPVDEYDGVIPRERTVYSRSTHISVDLGIALYF